MLTGLKIGNPLKICKAKIHIDASVFSRLLDQPAIIRLHYVDLLSIFVIRGHAIIVSELSTGYEMKVQVHHQEVLFKGFFTLHRAELSFEKFDGHMSKPVMRLAIERGDAVAVLTFDSKRRKIVFVRQFRFPMYLVESQKGWILEAVAGTIDDDGHPEVTAVREVEEEIGYVIGRDDLRYITTCSPSPGGLTERIHLYLADISQATRKTSGGGLEEEAEDIEVVELDYEEAFDLVSKGEINDAKTLICLLWLKSVAG